MNDKELKDFLVAKGMDAKSVATLAKDPTAWESLRRRYSRRVFKLEIVIPEGLDPAVDRERYVAILRSVEARIDQVSHVSDFLDILGTAVETGLPLLLKAAV